MRTAWIAALLVLVTAAPAGAATLTVSDPGDAGAGTLRQAIADANGNGTNDDIVFALPGAAPHVISLASPLPAVTQRLVINGGALAPGTGLPQVWIDANGSTGGAQVVYLDQ